LPVWQQLRCAILGPDAQSDPRLNLDSCRIIEAPDPRSGHSQVLDDLRTPADNLATANFILDELRRWTEVPDTSLVVSIAGGRKTMGALLYACASLLGRETDRLTHVLVNPPFDDPRLTPPFFFPAQTQRKLKVPDGTIVSPDSALIELADIPFVPLRNLFERDLVARPSSFAALVQACRKQVALQARRNLRLTLWRSRPQIQVNNAPPIKLSPKQHLFIMLLAEAAAAGDPAWSKYEAAVEPLKQLSEKLYSSRPPNDFSDWRYEVRLPTNADQLIFRKLRDELITKLKTGLPQTAGLISVLPQARRCSLDLLPKAIVFKD